MLFSFLYGYPAICPAMRLLIANHCPFLLSLAIPFFYFTLPSKKVKCFLEELYISDISDKSMANCCVSSQRLSCRRVTTFQKIGFSEISCLKSPSKFQIRTENAPADLPTSAFILFGALLPNSVQDLLDTTVITFTQMRRSAAELCGVALDFPLEICYLFLR